MSLCMIVKDEEQVIDRSLSSIWHLVDEIIVVDTGSNDHTKEIAAKYTPHIYEFKWIDDFSVARNYAASKASGEWILVIDADEYVDEENFKEFIKEIKNDKGMYDAYSAKILNFTGNYGENLVQNFHDRIYKNNSQISYYRKIHEQFKKQSGEPLKSKNSNLLIFHSGYLNETVDKKEKKQRNKELLDKEMSSGDNNAFDYFNFGNEYFSSGEYSKALESYLKAYKLKQDFRLSWVSTTLIQIVICLIHLRRYNDAIKVIADAESIYTTSPEIPYLKGEIFFVRGQLEDAKNMFLQIINNNEKYHHVIMRPDLKDQKPHNRLGQIYLYEENYERAIYHYTSVLNINKYNQESIKKVIYILNKFHSVAEISNFFNRENLVDSKNIKYYVEASFDFGNPDLALSILENFYEEHKNLYSVGLLKKLCIKKEENLEAFQDGLDYSLIKELVQLNWINVIDVFLLREFMKQNNIECDLMIHFEKEKALKTLIDILHNEYVEETIEESLFIFSLQTLINYKQFSLCETLLSNIQHLNQKSVSKVAALLFSNGFKTEALQLYEKAEWNYFSEQDFLNIINSLLQTENIADALNITKYAMSIYEQDFRFYKIILEHAQEDELYETTLLRARELFLDSFYLERFN